VACQREFRQPNLTGGTRNVACVLTSPRASTVACVLTSIAIDVGGRRTSPSYSGDAHRPGVGERDAQIANTKAHGDPPGATRRKVR